jgi:DNA-binding transcriptional regulator YbjK
VIRPLASLLHRSGLYTYLRRAWRDDISALRGDVQAIDRRLDAVLERLGDQQSVQELEGRLKDVQARQHDLRAELRRVKAVLEASRSRLFEEHRDATDRRVAAAHVATVVEGATLHDEPMPHMVIRDVLPDATYRALVDATPPDECFTERDPIKQNWVPAQGKLAPEFSHMMWRFMERSVIPDMLVPALLLRFRPHIDAVYRHRYGHRATAVSALSHEATAGRLMLRRPGYHLDPHLDPHRVIVTGLLYLARPGDDVSYGTQLFSINEAPRVAQTKTYYPREAGYTCTLVKTVPFEANTAVAFLNAGAGAHGADIPADAPARTKRYAYQFYISPPVQALAAITGETADEERDPA